MQWYYADQGKSVGPLSEDDFLKLAAAGTITPKTLVWHEGMQEWAPYEKLSQPTQAAQPATSTGTGKCRQCGKEFRLEEMVKFGDSMVCATCKPAFFQRLQEGATAGDGNTPNADLMAQARTSLSGSWGLAVGATFVSGLINALAGAIPMAGNLISFLISGAMALGLIIFFLSLSRGGETRFSMIFDGFSQFGRALGAYFFMNLFIILWTLLLIIPGIIAGLSYSMTFYILADNPSIGPLDAIKRSKAMMYGRRWKFFCLQFRFLGWALLCIPTLFIGLLWLIPYISCTSVKFYEDVKGRAIEST